MDGNRPSDVLSPECPSRQVLRHLTSTWGVLVLIVLLKGEHRFSALKRRVGGVSERMLAQTLQQLEGDGMVLRVAHPVVPPHGLGAVLHRLHRHIGRGRGDMWQR